jgi:outer membrane protein TolC
MSAQHSHTWLMGTALLVIASSVASAQPSQPSQPTTQPSAQPDAPHQVRLPVAASGLTADAAARRAAQTAPEVLHARASVAQAATESRIAASAFLPRLDLRAAYTRLGEVEQQPFEFGGQPISLFPQILNSYQLHGGIAFPVSDYFLTIAPGYKASKKAAEIATHQLRAQREAAAFTARHHYYAYARAVAAERVAQSAVQQLESHVADLDALVKAGTTTRGDLMQAQAQLANARVQLSAAQGAVRTLGDQLRVYLGMEASAPLVLGEDVLQAPPAAEPSPAELEARALADRPEAAALRALVEASQLSVQVQEGRRWPSLALIGAYDYANPNPRALPQEEQFTGSWSASVVLSWSPNDAIARKADIGRAELEVSRARTDLVELERRIRNEASQAASDLHVAREQIAAAQQGVTAAREAWRVQRDLLGAGEATELATLDAQAALTRAEQSFIDAQIAARIARARADYVVGRATPK